MHLLSQINNNLRHPDEMSWNHVSMCILNGGGIRSPIDERNNGMFLLRGLSSVYVFLTKPPGSLSPSLPAALTHVLDPSPLKSMPHPTSHTRCAFSDAFAHRGRS